MMQKAHFIKEVHYECRNNRISGWKESICKVCNARGGGTVEPPYDPILENNSWKTIDKYSRAGKAKELWSIGDVKDGYTIVGFDHDDLSDGSGKAGITFAVNDFAKTRSDVWDESDGKSFVRYDASTVYANLENIYGELSEINPYIKQVIKKIRNSDTVSGYTVSA